MTTEERRIKADKAKALNDKLTEAIKSADAVAEEFAEFARNELPFDVWQAVVTAQKALWVPRDVTHLIFTILMQFKYEQDE